MWRHCVFVCVCDWTESFSHPSERKTLSEIYQKDFAPICYLIFTVTFDTTPEDITLVWFIIYTDSGLWNNTYLMD